nr:hypothetical protein [uncultured Erythrobacter sp.]
MSNENSTADVDTKKASWATPSMDVIDVAAVTAGGTSGFDEDFDSFAS